MPDMDGRSETAAGRAEHSVLWLPLLRHLTELRADWAVWKNVDSALHGIGDVDTVAPGDAWGEVETAFRSWATEHGLGPVIACPHAPNLLHLVALDPAKPRFFELDINRRKIFLGSTLFVAADLVPLFQLDPRGFRRLRPGAEGLIKLSQNGFQRDGRANLEGLRRKQVRELLEEDPEGVRGAARLFGPAEGAMLAAATHVVEGRWSRRAALTAQGWSLVRALAEPRSVYHRVLFRVRKRRCPVLRAVFEHDRCIPGDRAAWLEEVARSHRLDARAASSAVGGTA